MSTAQPTQGNPEKKNEKMNLIVGIGVALLLLFGLVSCLGGGDDDEAAEGTATATAEEAPASSEAPANVADGVDPVMGPQEWYDQEVYRANNCASQNLAFGGVPMCAIRGVDTENGGTMLVGYIDQDEEGVQEHFAQEQRRDMMVQAFAERVGGAKFEGDPRVQHVTDVRIIASGGKGLGSGWQGEAAVQ